MNLLSASTGTLIDTSSSSTPTRFFSRYRRRAPRLLTCMRKRRREETEVDEFLNENEDSRRMRTEKSQRKKQVRSVWTMLMLSVVMMEESWISFSSSLQSAGTPGRWNDSSRLLHTSYSVMLMVNKTLHKFGPCTRNYGRDTTIGCSCTCWQYQKHIRLKNILRAVIKQGMLVGLL